MTKKATTPASKGIQINSYQITTIQEVSTTGKQSRKYSHLGRLVKGPTNIAFKIDIERDSYDSQSGAQIRLFNADQLEWKQVASIHYSLMATLKTVNVHSERQSTLADFHLDRNQLLVLATEILG